MTRMTAEKATERLQEAIAEMRKAADAVDQAHAMMRDLGLEKYVECGRGPYRQTLADAYNNVTGLLADMEELKCPDCGERASASPQCLVRCPSIAEAMDALAEVNQ